MPTFGGMPSKMLRRQDMNDMYSDPSLGEGATDQAEMSSGTINVKWFPRVYWIFVGSVIAAFAVGNYAQYRIYKHRFFATTSTPERSKTKTLR